MDEHHVHGTHGTHGGGDPDPDIPVRTIAWYGVWLVVLAAVAFVGMWLTFRFLEGRVEPPPELPVRVERPEAPPPPEPRVEHRPLETLQRLRAVEAERLQEYRWIDEGEGKVQIPIERAMEILAEEGLPAREDREPPADDAIGEEEEEEEEEE